jgi:hypothetical protein
VILRLLCKHIPDCRILGHSFRAGIPSALSAVPDLVTPKEIQAWGRWASDSYKAYTKLSHLGRQQIFEKYRICCSQNPRNNIWETYNNSDCILGPFYPYIHAARLHSFFN